MVRFLSEGTWGLYLRAVVGNNYAWRFCFAMANSVVASAMSTRSPSYLAPSRRIRSGIWVRTRWMGQNRGQGLAQDSWEARMAAATPVSTQCNFRPVYGWSWALPNLDVPTRPI